MISKMRNIHKSTPPSFRRRENPAAIVKAPPLGINFKNGPTPDRGAVPNPAKRRRHAFSAVAFLAAVAFGLLFLLPGGLVQAQNDGTIEYAENGTDPVATYTGLDPEGRPVYWSLVPGGTADVDLNNDGDTGDPGESDNPSADEGDFSISANGVLSFKLPPDFEMPKGAAPRVGADDPKLAAQNVYKIVVVASDDALGAVLDSLGNDSREKAYHKVTVTVTDVDEDGSISFSAQQPQVGVALTATLKDEDADDTDNAAEGKQIGEKWKWYYCSAVGTTCAVIPGETDKTYTPGAVIVGRELMAVATYKDASGSKEVEALAAHAVRAVPSGGNAAPVFPPSASSRSVDENSPPGTPVGVPVAAGDAGDILTYSLSEDVAGFYSIDAATGQITVSSRTMLDRELDGFEGDHTVKVLAIDPHADPNADSGDAAVGDGNSHSVDVTITVKDVNEAPSITAGPTKVKWVENDKAIPGVGTNDSALPAPTYTASDPETAEPGACVMCTWSLTGPDAGDLDFSNDPTSFGQLTFKKAPNFEKPADANMDNVYMVTVVVTDPGMSTDRAIGVGKLTAMRDVAITVTNKKENGKITFSHNQPKQGVEFIVTLTDDDGPTNVTKWKWERDAVVGETPTVSCSGVAAEDWEDAEGKGAKTDTYTPEAADLGKCLRVIPTYTDPLGVSMVTNNNVSTNPVVEDRENKSPQFKDDNNKVITSTTRSVAEDAVTDGTPTPDVGDVVSATDGTDTLTYTLGGTDARYFEITDANSSTGQITVKEDTKLDYETKNSYMVTVTATDPSLASTTIDVTINVTDVNEGPEFTAPKEGDVDVAVKENTRSLNIYSFRATDPEGRTVYWSLDDTSAVSTDVSAFTISDRGALSLNASPNYEDDVGLGPDKTYTVVVVAADDAPGAGIPTEEDPIRTSMKTVTVTVEDVEEKGAITTSPKYPHLGVDVTAVLDDDDGETGAVTWEWKVGTAVVGSNSISYALEADDVRKTLSVKATYTQDGDGVTITKSAGTVREARPDNAPPVFTDTGENNARSVDENARAGTTLGKVIKAIDENKDSLTYSLTGEDASSFRLSTSGQLSTAAVLDHEGDGETLAITIMATDPWGASGPIQVTVTVKDVNEAPMITAGPTRRDRAENVTDDALQVFTYVASDVDADDEVDDLTWSIEGEDAAKFNISEDDGTLTFEESPNYEMPADRNKDNVYKVTVVVSDDGSPKLTDKRQVEVTVTDVEEPGVVSLSSVQPKVAIQQTAALEDSDGDFKDVEWQWYRSNADSCPTALTNVDQALIDELAAADSAWSKIPDAESDTYTPEAGTDKDEGKCLLALAKYNDRRGTSKAAAKQSDMVVIVNNDNRAPTFKENGVEITETTKKVDENTPNNDPSSETPAETTQGDFDTRVMAEDPNGDTLTYTLGGPDMASFNIGQDNPATPEDDEGGQLSTKAKLDYEAKNTYMVTVTATDPNGLSDTIDVTIKVIDVDEAPKIIVGGLVVRGISDINYAENDTGMVATYSAAGPDAADATWDLSGADAGAFSISSAGVLTFMASPNYESPADANTDNTYMVMVNANDGTNDAMKAVSVRVTNVEEMGEVTLWASATDALTMAPQVGETITGAVMDPDGGVMVESWQWSRTMDAADMNSWMDIQDATNAAYTVTEGDTGYHLRVMATYTDAAGTDMEYSMPTMMVTVVVEMMGEVTLWAGDDALTMAPQVGDTITGAVMDPDGGVTGESWQWSRTMDTADMSSWMDIQDATGAAYTVTEGDMGYYLRVMATYTDAVGTDTAMEYSMPTMMVTVVVVEMMGEVTLWAGDDALTMAPQVGDTITGAVMDPDGGVTGETWQWAKTMTPDIMDSWMDIQDATGAAYTVTEGDMGYYLRVMATYTDAVGTDTAMEYSMPSMMVVGAEAGDALLDRYDVDGDGIEKTEVLKAINDYLFGEGDEAISKPEVLRLINLYLFG